MSARGEGTIQAGERVVQVLFTNRALAEAEKELGRGIIGVVQTFVESGGIADVAALLRAGMEGARRDQRQGGRPVTILDAYEVLDEAGFGAVADVVMTAVAAVLGYGSGDDAGEDGEGGDDPNG